ICRLLSRPENRIALEIGYGGGRLLHAACHYFQAVIGIDIHAEADAVRDYLHTQGVTNFCLLQTDGAALACHDASLDFIYSLLCCNTCHRSMCWRRICAKYGAAYELAGLHSCM
ncbi:MAG: methyltransferase domain-containing protein, partial [Blastochloris sp.]|nr:methyltransferase domain-containing protein [Blastochloris sp.]